MADRVGQQLGNYKLIKPLGQGGFADVYLGEHVYLKTLAAIKVMYTRLTNNDRESFIREAQTVAHLRHNNIIRVLEFDVADDGSPYLVMDYAPLGTLRQRHPKGSRLSLTTILPYVKQIASALQYAHEQKLIHRDVKPENFLLSENGEVLLSDFGIAQVAQSSRSMDSAQGSIAGTIPYMAPEQIQGKPRPASDQYALSIVVYEWLCGRPPFQGSFVEIAAGHATAPPPSLRQQVPGLSPAVELVVRTALAKDSQQRFASVHAFAHALEQAYEIEKATRSLNKVILPDTTAPSPSSSIPPRSPSSIPSLHSAPTEEETVAQFFLPLDSSAADFPTRSIPSQPSITPTKEPLPPGVFFKSCPVCGFQTRSDDAFCLHCGSSLLPQSTSTQQAQLPEERTFIASSEWNADINNTVAEISPVSNPWGTPPATIAPTGWGMSQPQSAPQARGGLSTCPYCGAETRPGHNFCLNCGNRLLVPPLPASTIPAADNPTYQANNDSGGTIGTHFAPVWSTVAPNDQSVIDERSILQLPPPTAIPARYLGLTTDEMKEQLFKEGDEHYKAKRYKDALDAYQRIIQLDAQDVDAHGKKGNALGRLGRYRDAVEAYTTALNIDARHPSLWSAKGDMLGKLRLFDEALAAYNQALSLKSSDPLLWVNKGGVLSRVKNYDEALIAYDAALGINSKDAEIWAAKGSLLFKLERYNEALVAYTCCVEYAPRKAANWEARGDVFSKLERFTEALSDYERAYHINPKATILHKCTMHRTLKYQQEELERKRLQQEEQERKRLQEELERKRQQELERKRLQEEQERKQQQEELERKRIQEELAAQASELKSRRFGYSTRRYPPPQRPQAGGQQERAGDKTQIVQVFDVFLSYSQEDAPWVEELAGRLKDDAGLDVWYDKWILVPGEPWIPAKFQAIEQARSCVVCIGKETPISWFEQEIEKAVNRQRNDPKFRVIPILLPTAEILLPNAENDDIKVKMKNFLELNTWVDFRKSDYEYAFHVLVSGIQGKPPGRWPPEETYSNISETEAQRKLRQLRQFMLEGIVDKEIVVEYQRQVLTKIWLSSTKDDANE